MEGNFGRDTYRSGYAAAPLISSTPVSHNHPLYRPCRIRQDDFCSSTKIAARYTVALHSVTRGKGSFEHESHEGGKVQIQFAIPNKTNYDTVAATIEKWLKPFETAEEATAFGKNFGNTASGVFVKEVKLGMSPSEVESVMGLPISKADLGEKVLYKYKDMTVEFHNGKVTDVR